MWLRISQILYILIIWFCLLNLSVIENMLKLANMIVSFSFFLICIFCFIYFEATLLAARSLRSIESFWLIDIFIIMKWPSLSSGMPFASKSILSYKIRPCSFLLVSVLLVLLCPSTQGTSLFYLFILRCFVF